MTSLIILLILTGCGSQAKFHAAANINVGHTKELLIQALTTCLPYIGYPRALNALNCIG